LTIIKNLKTKKKTSKAFIVHVPYYQTTFLNKIFVFLFQYPIFLINKKKTINVNFKESLKSGHAKN